MPPILNRYLRSSKVHSLIVALVAVPFTLHADPDFTSIFMIIGLAILVLIACCLTSILSIFFPSGLLWRTSVILFIVASICSIPIAVDAQTGHGYADFGGGWTLGYFLAALALLIRELRHGSGKRAWLTFGLLMLIIPKLVSGSFFLVLNLLSVHFKAGFPWLTIVYFLIYFAILWFFIVREQKAGRAMVRSVRDFIPLAKQILIVGLVPIIAPMPLGLLASIVEFDFTYFLDTFYVFSSLNLLSYLALLLGAGLLIAYFRTERTSA